MVARRRRARIAAIGIAVCTMVVLAGARGAAASPVAAPTVVLTSTTAGCPSETFCIYQLTDYGGRNGDGYGFPAPGTAGLPAHTYKQCTFDGLRYRSGKAIDNSASAMVNNTRFYVVLWQLKGCTGSKYVARPHSVDTTFVNNGFDNKASAVEFVDDRT